MLDIISRSFFGIGAFGAGMLLVIQSSLGAGFLAITVTPYMPVTQPPSAPSTP